MIHTHCKKLKYRRKIVLVTNGDGPMDDDGLDDIISKLTDDGIQLVVMCALRLLLDDIVSAPAD